MHLNERRKNRDPENRIGGDVASVAGNGDLVGSTRGCAIDRRAKAVCTSRHRWGLMRALSESRLPGEM